MPGNQGANKIILQVQAVCLLLGNFSLLILLINFGQKKWSLHKKISFFKSYQII